MGIASMGLSMDAAMGYHGQGFAIDQGREMAVKILTISAQKPDSTGSGVFLAQTARRFKEAGHEVAVVCGVAPEDDPAASLATGIETYPVRFQTRELPFCVCGMSDVMPYPATRYRDLTPEMARRFKEEFARTIAEADRRFRPDLVICHHLYLATAVARQVLSHRRVCAVCHSTDLRQFVQHDLERPFIKEQIGSLDRILALHDAQAKEIRSVFDMPASRISLIGTGYDEDVFTMSASRIPLEDCDSGARLLYVGKIGLAKGVESLLCAADLLAEEGIPFALNLVGGHSDEDEYRRIRDRAERCLVRPRFLGKVPTERLVTAYRSSDVFILPSFFEGLPLVIAEALACGCKVVAADLPGIREFYGRFLPDAPIVYVTPPPMEDVDKPQRDQLPAYEQRLADAVAHAIAMPSCACDVTVLSWRRLAERMLEAAAMPSA